MSDVIISKLLAPLTMPSLHLHTTGAIQRTQSIAKRTEAAARRIKSSQPSTWKTFEDRIGTAKDDTDVAACLGEIRAMGVLLAASQSVDAQTSGADFRAHFCSAQACVEVTTATGATKNRVCPGQATNVGASIQVVESSIAPFSNPARTGDTIQGNAVSKLAAMKQSGYQADKVVPTVLWIDLNDLDAFPLSIGHEQTQPFMSQRGAVVSGAVWWANYGRKDDPIFDEVQLLGPTHGKYILEFEGRFANSAQFAGVVTDIDGELSLHENPMADKPLDEVSRRWFLGLEGAHIERSWIAWPDTESLANRVMSTRKTAKLLELSARA